MPESIQQQASPAVSLAYQGVEEAMPWQMLVDHLATETRSFDATLHVFSPAEPEASYYVVTSNRSSYRRPEWLHLALHLARDMFPTDRQPHSIDEFMSREQFQKTEIFREILYPGQLHYLLAYEVYRDKNVCIRLSIDRTPDQGPFNSADKQLLNSLSPHLIQAIRLRLRLQDQEGRIRLLEESLSNMGIGVLSLDHSGEILETNLHAETLIKKSTHLHVRNGRLCLEGSRNGRFRDVLGSLLVEGRKGVSRIRVEGVDGGRDLQLVVKPLLKESVGAITGTAAQVFIHELGAGHQGFDPARLQQMFSFTVREARLAVLIAEGCSLQEAATRLNVSINTVKTHLRGIYDKLGERRQARVATILNSSMAAMM